MPDDDLLRYIGGPMSYSPWWLVLGLLLIAALVGWYGVVLALTSTKGGLRETRLITLTRNQIHRRRFARAIHVIAERYRSGDLQAAPAGAAVSAELRSFLSAATGARAQYMHLEQIANSDELRSAAPILAQLNDAQFNAASTVDVGAAGDAAEELIRTWH